MIAHLFSFLGIAENSSVDVKNEIQLLLNLSNGSAQAQVHLIDFRVTVVCGNAIRVHSNAFRP